MAIEIRCGRHVGKVRYEHGAVSVELEDKGMCEYITDLFAGPVTILKPFRDPRIPGAMKEERRVSSEEDVKQVLLQHEADSDYWVQIPGRDVHENPLFRIRGFSLLKWNKDDVLPWFVVEHKLTGFQSFYHGRLKGMDSIYYHWFTTPITESGLVTDWVEFREEFAKLQDIPYSWR